MAIHMRRKCLLTLFVTTSLMLGYIVLSSFRTAHTLNSTSLEINKEETNKEEVKESEPFVYDKIDVKTEDLPTKSGLEGNSLANGCSVKETDPLDANILKYIKDFGEHNCSDEETRRRTTITRTKRNITHLEMNGENFQSVQMRNILYDESTGKHKNDEFKELFQAQLELDIVKGGSGMIRNLKSKRCISPSSTNYTTPDTITLKFTSVCTTPHTVFIFNDKGYLKHNLTGRCITPEKSPIVQNTKLVLSTACTHAFNVSSEGVIMHKESTFCVHPLWGGETPEENQELCLWLDCATNGRLQYNFFHFLEGKSYSLVAASPVEALELSIKYSSKDSKDSIFLLDLLPKNLPSSSTATNIYVLCFDEISLSHFQRKLPLSYTYMSEVMQLNIYKKYASVNPSLRDNTLTVINGDVDKGTESLFVTASKKEYATLYTSDSVVSALSKDFIQAHHNSAPFFHAVHQNFGVSSKHCINSQPVYDISLSYLDAFITSYKLNAKLAYLAISGITKFNFNLVGYMDKRLKQTLELLHKQTNSIVVIHSVKGSLTGKLGQLAVGRVEYKKPLLGIYTSPDIRDKILIKKSNHLVGPYDIHVTLKNILTNEKSKHKFGMSLSDEIPDRNCNEAGVYKTMCPCTS